FGEIARLEGASPRVFADRLRDSRGSLDWDLLMSLERVWQCDVFRAGDGVHKAWLERRAPFSTGLANVLRSWNPKHRALCRLEESLLRRGGARRVIVNSHMVKDEIVRLFGYPSELIDVIYNGLPASVFAEARQQRDRSRAELQLSPRDIAV